MRDYTKIKAFIHADSLVIDIYRLTREFPKSEIYGLTSQMRRAAVSVASNIVEGSGRNSTKEFTRFLDIAFASLRELKYQVSIAIRLGYLRENISEIEDKLVETEKTLSSYIKAIRKS